LVVRANSTLVSGKALGTVLGFASAGIIVPFGYDVAFLVNAASFVVSALVLASLPIRTQAGPVTSGSHSPVRTLLAFPTAVSAMVLLRGFDAFGSASHNVALPVFASTTNPAAPATFLS